MTLKTDCLVEVYEGIEDYQLGFQVCQAWKYKVLCHLNSLLKVYIKHQMSLCANLETTV